MSDQERIVAAAVRHDGMTYSMPAPNRHHNICHAMYHSGLPTDAQRDQGFLTSTGRYVDRKEGCLIAEAADQLNKIGPKTGPDHILFSEDLW